MGLLGELAPLEPCGAGAVRIVPIVHGRLEFALAAREAFLADPPDAVAVELPETLRGPMLRAVRRLPLLSLLEYPADGGPAYVLVEPTDGVVETLRLALELERPCHLVDRDVEGYAVHRDPVPDPYAIARIGHAAYAKAFLSLPPAPPDPLDAQREETMAYHVHRLAQTGAKVLFVCGLHHAERVRARLRTPPEARPLGRTRREGVVVSHLHADASREVLSEPPFLAGAYEQARAAAAGAPIEARAVDRYARLRELLLAARDRHHERSHERLAPAALKLILRFARNYALVEGGLSPDLFQTVVAARAGADDDFAWEVWSLAATYPFQEEAPSLPVARPTIEDLQARARHLRFNLKKPRLRRALRLVRERPREARPGEWQEAWRGQSICSYPPEDVAVEGYGDFLKKRAVSILSEERARVAPFSTSLCDGIDLRETLRNLATDGRLYVREQLPVRGRVGSVVVVFPDGDPPEGKDDARYEWLLTWQGEHEQESDMAMFATPPGAQLVGPGISRCEYGGFLLSYPPGRMFDVWEDPLFAGARSKAERLLLAAVDYSLERMVVYVGPRPPCSRVQQSAARLGKKIVYLPVGQLSPVMLRKLKVFHVLDGHGVRRWARDYLG